MKNTVKLICISIILLLCMLYPKQEVNAQTNLKTSITLDRVGFNDPDEVDYHLAKKIAEVNDCTYTEVKIIDKKIVSRVINTDYTVKYYNIPPLIETGETITVTGYKKGDELITQMKDEIKKNNDRIEEVKEITEAIAEYITYDVTYQLSKKNTTTKPTTSTSSKAKDGSLNLSVAYMNKGDTLQLKVNKLPQKVSKIEWESADTKIAKVSASGKVTAVGYGTTIIDATVYAGKYYYLSCRINVYKLSGYDAAVGELVTKIKLDRGEDINVGVSVQGLTYAIPERYFLPISMVKVEVSTSGGDLAKVEPDTYEGDNGVTYLCGFNIETYRDGVLTIKVSDKKTTCQLDIAIGTGVSRLDPVEAVKKNDFTGYEGDELKTLTTVRNFIDKNNLYSESMSTREKIEHIVDYFIQTYNLERYKPLDHGTIYWTMIEGRGLCGYYSETFSFLCDCLGIKNLEVTGIAYNGGYAAAHAWNKVEVDGTWYYIDSFWCAGLRNKNKYFLTEELWSDHVQRNITNFYDYGEILYLNNIH